MRFDSILDSADRLRSNSPVVKIVEEYVETLLLRINSNIQDAYQLQKDNIIFRLPFNFDLGQTHVSNEEVQIQVYYIIIEELEKKDYKIKMKIDDASAHIFISWKQIINNKNLINMKKKVFSLSLR